MSFSRLHISVFLGLAVALWALALWAYRTPFAIEHLAPFGSVVGALAALGISFDRSLWHLRPLHGWFVKRPDLRGTWKVELRSDWTDPATGKPVAPIAGFMGVTQTLSSLQMHLMTPESEAWLIAEHIQPSPNGTGYRIAAAYTNKPNLPLRGTRSEIHHGAFVLDTHVRRTDRKASPASTGPTERRRGR